MDVILEFNENDLKTISFMIYILKITTVKHLIFVWNALWALVSKDIMQFLLLSWHKLDPCKTKQYRINFFYFGGKRKDFWTNNVELNLFVSFCCLNHVNQFNNLSRCSLFGRPTVRVHSTAYFFTCQTLQLFIYMKGCNWMKQHGYSTSI